MFLSLFGEALWSITTMSNSFLNEIGLSPGRVNCKTIGLVRKQQGVEYIYVLIVSPNGRQKKGYTKPKATMNPSRNNETSQTSTSMNVSHHKQILDYKR